MTSPTPLIIIVAFRLISLSAVNFTVPEVSSISLLIKISASSASATRLKLPLPLRSIPFSSVCTVMLPASAVIRISPEPPISLMISCRILRSPPAADSVIQMLPVAPLLVASKVIVSISISSASPIPKAAAKTTVAAEILAVSPVKLSTTAPVKAAT